MPDEPRNCPSCGEKVLPKARLCHYCDYSFARPGPKWIWFRRVKLADLGALFGIVSVLVAIAAYVEARQATSSQSAFQARQEVEQSAPILAPDTAPDERGRNMTVTTQSSNKPVSKRADWLYLNPLAVPNPPRSRIVIPVRDGGAGTGMTVGLPLVVQDCTSEPKYLPPSAMGTVGSYTVPPGATDQLAYLSPERGKTDLANAPNGGYVAVGHQRFWYSWDYGRFGTPGSTINVLLLYTNSALSQLRWTCATYGPTNRYFQWDLQGEEYGERTPPKPLVTQ